MGDLWLEYEGKKKSIVDYKRYKILKSDYS